MSHADRLEVSLRKDLQGKKGEKRMSTAGRLVRRMMKKLALPVILMVAFILSGVVPTTPASAAASTFTQSQSFPIDIQLDPNPCNGEPVVLSGNLHDLFSVTFDGAGGVHFDFLDNPQGVSGVGQVTGAKYQATGEFLEHLNFTVGVQETFVSNFKIIGQGADNNYLVHENFHVTVNADGTLTAYVDNFSITCR